MSSLQHVLALAWGFLTFPLYSEPFIKDRAPHRLSKVDPSHTLEESHFSCLYVGSHSLGHNPQLVMIGDMFLHFYCVINSH